MDSWSVKDGGEDTEERVKMPHSEMCKESEITSVEEGYDVDGRHAPQSDETAGNLKLSKDEVSACLTALKKKGLDRRTDHQAETQPRSARRIEGESVRETRVPSTCWATGQSQERLSWRLVAISTCKSHLLRSFPLHYQVNRMI